MKEDGSYYREVARIQRELKKKRKDYEKKRISVLKKMGKMEKLLEEVTDEVGEFCGSNLKGGMTGYANLSVLIKMYSEDRMKDLTYFAREGHPRL